jgi:steroid delta-isomerase-like uncharacterized protein
MSTETNKNTARRLVEELFNSKNYEVIDELFAPDFVEHEEIPGIDSGREGVRQASQMFHAAFPDLQVIIQDILADGDKVVAREQWTGTNQGEFMGMPATGKQVAFNVVDIIRFADGKLVEHWAVTDMLALLTQLGAIPEPDGVGI